MTIEQEYEQAFLRQAQINDLLAQNQEQTEKLVDERKALRAEREKVSQAMEKLKTAKTIQTHEEAAAEARKQADAARTEAEAFKADLANQKKEADELLAKLREQVEKKPE